MARVIGRRVAAQRKKRGLSGPSLASRLGIHRSYLWRIEKGKTLPSLALIDKLARFCGVSFDDLRRAEAA